MVMEHSTGLKLNADGKGREGRLARKDWTAPQRDGVEVVEW